MKKVYKRSYDEYPYESGLERLYKVSEEMQRDAYLKEVLSSYRQAFLESNTKFIFVISLDMQFATCQMLKMLSKLEDLNNSVIIIQSLLDFETQARAMERERGYFSEDLSFAFKFFSPNNIFSE